MKKIFKSIKSILIATASVGAIAGSTAAVVSCGETPQTKLSNQINDLINNFQNTLGKYITINHQSYSFSDYERDMKDHSFITQNKKIDDLGEFYLNKNTDFPKAYDLYADINSETSNMMIIELDQIEKFDGQNKVQIDNIKNFSSILFHTYFYENKDFTNISGGLQQVYNLNPGTYIEDLSDFISENMLSLYTLKNDIEAIV